MKLQAYVEDNKTYSTAADAPEAQPEPEATLPQPSSKSNNPSAVIPTSTGFTIGGTDAFVIPFLCLTATKLFLYQIQT